MDPFFIIGMLEIFQECTIHRREYFARLTAEKPSDFLPVELEGRRRHRWDRKGGDGTGGTEKAGTAMEGQKRRGRQ